MLSERFSNLGCELSMTPAIAVRIKVAAAATDYNGLVKWIMDLMSLVYETHLRDIGARRVSCACCPTGLGPSRKTLELNLSGW